MADLVALEMQRVKALEETYGGLPSRTSNAFFGVGPITDGTADEAESRRLRFDFEAWLEKNYRKLDDTGRDIGAFTAAELSRSMHRGYPADKILCDMMREIHRYFEFPKANKVAVGLGGGHSGFTVCLLHLLNTADVDQHIFVDTPRPETSDGKSGGFFRQSWGAQLIELYQKSPLGDEQRLHFAETEGSIPSADELERMSIKIFVGVGHETTGATTYTQRDMDNLLEWLSRDPDNRHAVFDVTSMLGAMPWDDSTVRAAMSRICMFTPFQKAIGGISGYFIASFTPQALSLIERNQKDPSFAIPRQLKLAVPVDPKLPISGDRTVKVGPFYDPEQDKMLGGVINTYSTLAFAETTFGLLRSEGRIGSVAELNQRSRENRTVVEKWIEGQSLLQLGVANPESRGTAVTLLKINDPDIADAGIHARILARSKQLLGYEGVTHPNGEHEPGLDVARYVNAFPGTPGDYRAWIGGIRTPDDVAALLDNIAYAYRRAKIVVLEEELAKEGKTFTASKSEPDAVTSDKAYAVLICDPVGLRFGADGKPDHSDVKNHIEARCGVFHEGPLSDKARLEKGKIHFFYQPDLSTETELLPITDKGQYDAVIAAATFLPKASVFPEGGVRIGAGTGNMGSASWGGGNGTGGGAPLMNTPSFNSRATAQMVFKALLKVLPDLDTATLHERTVAGQFDTGKNLKEFSTEKLEGKRMAVIGYGNIGREVAKLAKAFGMEVSIFARPKHQEWIESEGFRYAATPEAAARGADVLSPHTGLGSLDPVSGRYANAGLVGSSVLQSLNNGAVLINYDRGELVDADALDAALASGMLRYAAIDADLFRDAGTGEVSGPMKPYLAIGEKHKGKLELLPHAAADTDHPSRVDGAKQAVDQLIDAIRHRRVTNLKGDLPEGYVDAGACTVAGVGKATERDLKAAVADVGNLAEARKLAEELAAIWGSLSAVTGPHRRQELLSRYGADLVKASNRYTTLMAKLGLEGAY
jgi:lactate dehydrogenase-like 2-hydroxyacid dehydrogenase/phosphoserine aminotransferase